MNQKYEKLLVNDKEIYLVGTAHVSNISAQQVKEVIEEVNPDCIAIELDQKRYDSILNPEQYKNQDILSIIKEKKVGLLFITIILSSFQKRVAKSLDATSGGEMLQAITMSEIKNIPLSLVDRNVNITLKRIWAKHSFFAKMKLIASLFTSVFEEESISEEEIEQLKQSDMLETALNDIGKQFPIVKTVLVDERDQYLAMKIKQSEGKKIVAVVGAAHQPGIKRYIYEDHDLTQLESIPKKSWISKALGWLIPISILAILAISFHADTSIGVKQLFTWTLYNGTLSAFGVLLAKGHILSILVAFIMAPITSLSPLLAAGWFAGISEAYLRKPQVKDFESLSEDVNSFKGFYNNKVTHILLVVIMANIFSTVATFLGGSELIKTLLNLK